MTKDQFAKLVYRLQRMQRMTIGSALDFRVMTFKRQDETNDVMAVECAAYYKEKLLQYIQVFENQDYKINSDKVKEMYEYLRSNKWI